MGRQAGTTRSTFAGRPPACLSRQWMREVEFVPVGSARSAWGGCMNANIDHGEPFMPQLAARHSLQRVVLSLSLLAFLGACSTASKDITAAYVSPMQYQSYDCQQLNAESQRIQSRYQELGGRLDQAASNDKTLVGVGMILFWPALFALGGTKQQEAEYSRLKGEYDAVQQTSVQRRCGMGAQQTAATAAPAASAVAN